MPTFIYKNQIIEYTLSRKARKNVNFRINSSGDIHISAPRYVTKKDLDKLIYDKAEWLIKSKEKIISKKSKSITSIVKTGNTIYLNGYPYTINVALNTKNNVSIQDNTIFIEIKNSKENSQEYIDSYFDSWLRNVTYELTNQYVDKYLIDLKKYNIQKPDIAIRTMSSRWGSCIPSKNKITINKKLVYSPFECLEYVVLHELAHLVEANHSKKFYNIIENVMPDWKNRRKILNDF